MEQNMIPEDLKQYDTESARQAYQSYKSGISADLQEYDTEDARYAYQQYKLDSQRNRGLQTSDNRILQLSKDVVDWVSNRYQSTWANGMMPQSSASKYSNKSKYDAWALQAGMPSEKELDKYLSEYERYMGSGNVSSAYGNVSDAQWKKINELWSKDWQYGLTDEDSRRQAAGRAPVSYDSMYEDTLLDDQLKALGLPPSKLLNGKLGETYRAWENDAKNYSKVMNEAARKYVSENDAESKVKRFAGNISTVLSGGKANAQYTMEDALRDTINDPKWADYAQKHYGAAMKIPNPDDEEFIVKEDGFPKLDDNGNYVYDQEKYQKAWDKAVKNNLGIDNDEFSITLDKLQDYYAQNGAIIKADMAAQQWFDSKGVKYDYDTRYNDSNYVAKMNDLYAGELINNGEGFSLEMLFPDVQFSEDDRKAYQPIIDEANRLRITEGYDAAREYVLGGEFSAALHKVNNDRIVAELREINANVPGYDEKTDAEILHGYYENIGKSYLMSDDDIAKLKNGEITLDNYVAERCKTTDSANEYAGERYKQYCEQHNLPASAAEWQEARKQLQNMSEYLMSLTESQRDLLNTSEAAWDKSHSYWSKAASMYSSKEDAIRAESNGASPRDPVSFGSVVEEWEYAQEMERKYNDAKAILERLHDINPRWDSSKTRDDQATFSNNMWDDAYAQKLAFQADAFAYTPEFAEKTADKAYVDQRFNEIIYNHANSLIHEWDESIAAYATDEDKAKVVYMFDSNDGKTVAASTYLNKYMMRQWDMSRRIDNADKQQYFGSESDSGFVRWLGATANTGLSVLTGIVEGAGNYFYDTLALATGHDIYSSNRMTWTSDSMANLSQHLVERDGNQIGAFAINLIPSMAQSAAGMALAVATDGATEAFTLSLMGTQSYSNAVDEALKNGATSEQAYLIGLANGANEMIFEKLSLDAFIADIDVTRAALDAAKASGKYSTKQLTGLLAKKMLQRAGTQGFVEGSEELFTSIANLLAENWILADKSAFNKTVQHYMDAGMSEAEAKSLANEEIMRDVVMDFVGGFVSGALMAAGGDLIKTKGGRFYMDRSGVTDFLLQTHNLSLVSFDDALAYANANLEVDSDKKISAASAQKVFDDLRKQGADAATLSRIMNTYSDNATPDAMTVMRTAITDQKNEDGKKLVKAASKYVYNRQAQGKSNVTKGQIEFATKEWLDHYSGAVQQGDIRELANNARMMREGYIEDIARLAGGSYVATGMTQMSEYYASLPADVQQRITQNAEQYKATFNEAFADGNRAAQYANVAAIMEYAVGEGKALQGLNSIFGDGAAVAPQAVRNAILGTDSTTAQRYIDRVAESVALLNRQNGNHLFSAAQNGVDATAYVAPQFALAQSMPHDSLSKSMYDYIAKYGATNEAMDLLTAATIHESNSPFARQIRLTAGTFYTSEQLQQITDEYQKALTDYNEKLKIKQAHEQADAQERTEHESRIANYTEQIAQLEQAVKEDTSLAKTFGSRVAELQTAKSAFETLVAKQNQRMTQTNADVNEAERKYKAAKTKYWNAMQDQSAQYIQRFGSSLEAIKGRQRISHAELMRMSALAQFGTAENLNDINTKIIASEKASAVALGRALGVDVQCVEFGKAFFDEKKIAQSNRNETSPGVVIGGTVYLNTKVMEARVGSLTDQVLMHELGHILESSADNYKKYAKFAKDFLIKRDGKGAYDFAKKAFMESGMTEQQAERELAAEFTRQVTLADPRAVAALCKSAPKMSMRIFQWLTNTRNRMNSVATAQSKIIIDAQREFAAGMKAIRNTEVAEQSTDDAAVSISPTRNAMTNAMNQLQERMRLEAEAQRNAAQQQTAEQQPAQPAQTEQKAEAQTETEAPTEEAPAQPVAEEAEQSAEAVEETPIETPEETVSEEPKEDFADVKPETKIKAAYYTEYDPASFNAKEHDAEYMELAKKFRNGTASGKDINKLRSLVNAQALHNGSAGNDVGDPLDLYHGNSYAFGFTEIEPNYRGLIFTSTDPYVANGYAGVAKSEMDEAFSRDVLTAVDQKLSQNYLDNMSAFGLAKRANAIIPGAKIAVTNKGNYPSLDRFEDTDTGETFTRNKLYDRMRNAYFEAMPNDELLRYARGILPNSILEETTVDGFDFVDNVSGEFLDRDDLITELVKESQKGIYHLYGFPGNNQYRTDAEEGMWSELDDEMGDDTDTIAANARRRFGATSTRIDRVIDPGGDYPGSDNVADDLIFYESSQVKLADLVTVDDDGEIIPLSERFRADRTGDESWKNNDARYYTEYDPQAIEIRRSIDGLSERENMMSGKPRMIQTDNGYVVARQVSREGFVTGNPMFNTKRQNMAMIAPISEFRGDVKRPVSASQCTAVVVPNSDAYAETRADARNAGTSVYAYDESDPSQFDRAIDRAANMSSVAYFPSMTYDELIDRYNSIPQGMKPRVENRRVPRQTTDTNRVSQTARTIAEAPITTDQGYSDIQSWIANDNAGTFEPVSNTKSLNRARGVIERSGSLSQAAEDLHSAVANGDGKATDLLARAELLYAEAQNPNSELTAIQREHIFADLCMIASDAGRALQLTSQLKRMTPEGHIDYIEQVGKRMADKYNKRTKQNVDLSLTEEEKEGYRRAVTDEQRKEIDKEVGKRWSEETKDLPLLERIRNWRYFAMLGNARTHFRNMVGNALMNPVARFKDFNNAWLQAAFNIDEADRTTALWTGKVDAATKQFVEEQLKRMLPIMQSGSSKYMEEIAKVPTADDDVEGSWFKRTMKALTQPVNTARLSNSDKGIGGLLNKLSYINSNALELEDAKALGLRFRSSMYQIIKARGLDVTNMTNEQLESIVNYSAQEALRATFRDASVLADALNRFANTNRATRFAMEAIVPFRKTPINIAKRSFEYSPLGLINGMYKLFTNSTQYKSGLAEIDANTKLTDAQKQQRRAELETKHKQQKIVAIDRLAQGVTGSLLSLIGYFAASMGWISIGRKDDDKASFEQALGKNTYSLNIGDISIDLSAFSPAAVPMLMGTALYQSMNAEHDANLVSSMIDVLAESVDPITEMSMISGIADALSGIGSQRDDGANTRWAMQIAGNAIESYVGQFVPTFVGQAERAIDPYARSYSAGDEYWASDLFGSEIGTAVKKLQNKVGLGWLSEPKVNLHGEEQRNYTNFGSWVRNVANNWILPATIKADQKNDIDDELIRLYGVVDSADIFPSKPSRNLGSYNNTPIKLSNDAEYMEYQKEYGQTVYDMLEDLMQSRSYAYMTDTQKAEAVERVIDQAKSATKKRWKAKKVAAMEK